MRPRFLSIVLVTLMALAFGQTAKADLAAVGPVDPATEFPTFFTDRAGVSLGPCDTVDPAGPLGPNNPPCSGLELVDPTGLFVAGNIAEFTYYRGEAGLSGPDGDRYLLRFEVQGGVAPPPLVANAVRVRLRSLPLEGDYVLTTPFGVVTFTATAEGVPPAIPDIDDVLPGGADGIGPDFAGTLPGNNQCFLSNGTGFADATGTYFGDGITEAPLFRDPACGIAARPTGPLLFRVVRPDLVALETNVFSVEGKIFSVGPPPPGGATPLSVQRATYARTNPGFADVFATAPAGAIVTVSGGPNLGGPHLMTGNASGQFFAHIPFDPDSSTLPLSVTVTATADPLLPSNVIEPLRDVVTITKAEYNTTDKTLTIEAVSSDQMAPGPTLTAVGFGVLASALVVSDVDAPPSEVTVTSSQGGTDTEPVNVVTTTPPPPPPPAGAFSISGTVAQTDGIPISGVTMNLTGAATGTTLTGLDGTYAFIGLANGTYTVTPQAGSRRFRPISRTVTINGADVSGQNFTGSR